MVSLAMSGPGSSYGKDQIAKFDYRYLTRKGIEGLNYAKDRAVRLDYNHLFSEISDRIKDHPYQTAFHVVNGVVFLAPGLVTGPILWGMGFGPLGPVAGSHAAAYQAMIGNIPTGGLFAYLQSAGAAGYGVAGVNAIARASAVVTGATSLLNTRRENGAQNEVEEGSLKEKIAGGSLVDQLKTLWNRNGL